MKDAPMTTTDRARAYLAKLPAAVAGNGGHAATFATACRLVEFGLAESEAWSLLCEWNRSHCQPPWQEAELRHKLTDAYRHTSPRPEFNAPRPASRSRPVSSASPAGKRPALPALRAGTARELAALATLRGLAVEGIEVAQERGLLRFGDWRRQAAWFVLDGSSRVAQARRMDGQPWRKPDGSDFKAWTLPGSAGAWPVGIGEAEDFAHLALVEGGPDLLAACQFLWCEDREHDCAPVAMLGGSAAIHADALPLFAGKRVRIFPHVDPTGDNAALRWAEQLTAAGAAVDAFNFAGLRRSDGAPVKDLCDFAALHPDDFESDRQLWAILP